MFEITTNDFILGCLCFAFVHWLAFTGLYYAYKDMKKAQADRQRYKTMIIDGKEVDPKNVVGFPEMAFDCTLVIALILEGIMLPCNIGYIYTFVTQ